MLILFYERGEAVLYKVVAVRGIFSSFNTIFRSDFTFLLNIELYFLRARNGYGIICGLSYLDSTVGLSAFIFVITLDLERGLKLLSYQEFSLKVLCVRSV